MRRGRLWGLVAMVVTSACGKAPSDGVGAVASEGAASAETSARAGAGAGADSGGSAGADSGTGTVSGLGAGAGGSWRGAYKSVAIGITLPADVKWHVPDSTTGIGEGTITLAIDPSNGRVRGTIDGALGPASLDGLAAGGRLTAAVVRQDPTDHGFTGTLAGDLGAASARGEMHVSLAEASAVRDATFELEPVKGAEAAR